MASPESAGRQAGNHRVVASKRPQPNTLRRNGTLGPALLPDLVVVAGSQNTHIHSSGCFWWRWRVLKNFRIGHPKGDKLLIIPANGNVRVYVLNFMSLRLGGNCFPISGTGIG